MDVRWDLNGTPDRGKRLLRPIDGRAQHGSGTLLQLTASGTTTEVLSVGYAIEIVEWDLKACELGPDAAAQGAPLLAHGWKALADDLGAPDANLDWVDGTVPMARGERVYARRGITIFLNPANDFIIHVALYPPTTVEDCVHRLRPKREKRTR